MLKKQGFFYCASLYLCDVIMIEQPLARASDRASQSILLAPGSIPVLGSSSSTTGGFPTSAMAVLSFRLLPPLYRIKRTFQNGSYFLCFKTDKNIFCFFKTYQNISRFKTDRNFGCFKTHCSFYEEPQSLIFLTEDCACKS